MTIALRSHHPPALVRRHLGIYDNNLPPRERAGAPRVFLGDFAFSSSPLIK